VSSCPAYSKIAGNGMVSPSEGPSIAPTGNLAHAQNAVKRLQAQKRLLVPLRITHRNTMYFWKNAAPGASRVRFPLPPPSCSQRRGRGRRFLSVAHRKSSGATRSANRCIETSRQLSWRPRDLRFRRAEIAVV
jgi:hypothetical protein